MRFLPGKTLVSVPLHVKNTWLRCFRGLSSLIRSCKKAVTTSGQVDLILISCLSCNGIPHNPHSSDPQQVNSFIAYMFIQEFAQLLIYWRILIVIGKKNKCLTFPCFHPKAAASSSSKATDLDMKGTKAGSKKKSL